jgi:hypothetical protein
MLNGLKCGATQCCGATHDMLPLPNIASSLLLLKAFSSPAPSTWCTPWPMFCERANQQWWDSCSATVTLPVSSTNACSNLHALSASGRLLTVPSKSKNTLSAKHSHSTSWVWMQSRWTNTFYSVATDCVLRELKQPTIYNVTNSFPWMDTISLQGKTNFFEKWVSEYAKSRVNTTSYTPPPSVVMFSLLMKF